MKPQFGTRIFSKRLVWGYLVFVHTLGCAGLQAGPAVEGMSAQDLVAHLATVAKDLQRRPAIALNSDKPQENFVIGMAEKGAGEIFAVGVRGGILQSVDGLHWRQMAVPTDVTLTAVRFVGQGEGWLGGHEGTIMHLPAGAEQWQLVRTDPEFDGPILDFLFFDEQVGLALSSGGRILRTSNGGKDWEVAEIVTEDFFNPHLFSAALTEANVAFVVGERGTVFRSSDLGVSWTELPSPFIGSLFGIVRLGMDSLLAYGITGHAFYSVDNGASWITLETGLEDSLFTHVRDGNDVLLFGADGVALRVVSGASGLPTVERLDKVGRFTISGVARGGDGRLLAATNNGIQRLDLIVKGH